MNLVPIRYPLRSLVVRWRSSLFSAIGIACTVAVIAGILALRSGFIELFGESGSDDVVIYMRPGATSEGESGIQREQVEVLKKERPEVKKDALGRPMAAGESYLALSLARLGRGTTNVPLRGIEEMSVTIQGDSFNLKEGRMLEFGSDEIIVGVPVTDRIANCRLNDTLLINLTPFKVVGTFEHDGAYSSEIWGDVDRITEAIDRPIFQRVVAKLKPGSDIESVSKALEVDKRVPTKVMSERAYLTSQKNVLGVIFVILAGLIGSIMGLAAVLGAATTMLASIGSRTREIGIMLALGFSRFSIFLAFVFEALLIGIIGGVLGALAVLPFNGIQTGTTNFQTFTEVSFAFRITPSLLLTAISIAVLLGVLGGVVPAWRASRLTPTVALRK